jgi:SAM-dependent methyltransferase
MNSEQGDRKAQEIPVAAEHWPDISRLWKLVGPPLRPSAEDIGFVTDAIGSRLRDDRPPRALILGVTPELYRLPWPDKTKVLGSDHTQAMIDAVWPGPRNAVIRTEWTALPLRSGSCDIVLCDGGIHLMAYPDDHRLLVRTLHRVVARDGLCIFRLFVPPRERETAEKVLKDLLEARISNLNLLKLRLGMAMQDDVTRGVELGRVWDAFHRAAPDLNRLSSQIGWPLEHLQVINTYRNSPMRYYFMSVSDVRRLFCRDPGGFEFEKVYSPTYELGERCPTVVFRRADLRQGKDPTGNAP